MTQGPERWGATCFLALMLAFAACGDDAEPSPASEVPNSNRTSRAEKAAKAQDAFIESLDRACRPYEKAYEALAPTFERRAKEFDVEPAEGNQLSPEGAEALASLIEKRLVPRIQEVVSSLEDVSLPVKNRRAAKRFLQALEESLGAVVGDPKVLFLTDLRGQAFGETDVLSQDLELASCKVGYDIYS